MGGLKFAPIVKGHCQLSNDQGEKVSASASAYDTSKTSYQHVSLPRIGTWIHGRVGEQNEGKLLLRTSMILSVTVHFFLQPEPGQKVQRQFYLMPYTEGALLHYKHPPSAIGDIYGSYLDDKTRTSFCSQFQSLGGFMEGLVSPLKGTYFQMYNAQNISTAPRRLRWIYEQWRATADKTYPYLHSVHPILLTRLKRRIAMIKKQI